MPTSSSMTTPGWTNSSSAASQTTPSPRLTTESESTSETSIGLSVLLVVSIVVAVIIYRIYRWLKNRRIWVREDSQPTLIYHLPYNPEQDYYINPCQQGERGTSLSWKNPYTNSNIYLTPTPRSRPGTLADASTKLNKATFSKRKRRHSHVDDIDRHSSWPGTLVVNEPTFSRMWRNDSHHDGLHTSEAEDRTLAYVNATIEQGVDQAMETPQEPSGFFINKTLNTNGGELSIAGVKLTVLPGALTSPTTLQLGILHEERHRPTEYLGYKCGLLSPIVCCNPHKHTFKRPVTLSIPHCSGSIVPGCLHILYSDTPSDVPSKWTMLDSSQCDVVITDQEVCLAVDHFCLFVVVGDPPYKFMKLISFAPHLNVDHTFSIRVYCVNNYDDRKSVEEDETRLGGRLQHAAQPLTVHNDGQHVCVNITYCQDNRELICSSIPTTVWQFLLVWHAQTPNSSFILKPTDPTVREFLCQMEGFQAGHDEDKCQLSISCKQHFNRLADPPKHEVFNGHLRRFLMQKLDPPIVAVNTWPALAEHMGLQDELSWLQYQEIHHHESPTKYLLACWEDRCQSESQSYKYLREFRATMEELERHDIVAELTAYLDASEKNVNYQNRICDSTEKVDSGLASERTDAFELQPRK